MNRWLRRHARVLAASVAILLAVGLGLVLRSAGSAHAQPARVVARGQAIAPVLAPAAQRRQARARSVATTVAAAGGGTAVAISHRQRAAAARASAARAGAPAPAPTRRSEGLALRQATGLSLAQVTTHAVCPRATTGHATCAAQTLVLRSTGEPVRPHVAKYASLGRATPTRAHGARPAATASSVPPAPGTPAYLEQAYDLTALSQTGGAADTVAVVDAYNDPTAGSDMATYRSTYGLPACTFASGCFRKIGQTGGSPPTATDAGWMQETSLDLDAVSAVCPRCHILLVEANSNSFSDLEAAMQTAAGTPGVKQISASWGGISSGVPSVFRTFAGVATVAATGDTGYVGPGEDSYPAALPGVTAAGGTSLAPAGAPSARGFGEGAWSWDGANGGTSGCDLQFPRPAYQPAEGCAGRAYADMSADADPTTGLNVYQQGTGLHGSGWTVVGGTSLSTPLIAAYYAVTGVDGTSPQWAYSNSSALNDVVSGSSGNCAAAIAYICDAQAGYDGPTGVGSISGSVVAGAPGIGGPSIPGGSGNTYTAGVSAHAATISGGIYRNGLDTSWSIQYGTTMSYGSQTPAIDIGAGSAPVTVTGYLSQLAPGTTYHYRLVATNSAGTTAGYDYTFTTQSAATNAPTAAFTVSPNSPAPEGSVGFDGSSSAPPSRGSISTYSWNFGDGTPVENDTTATTTHPYARRGTYTVALTVTSNGQTDSSTQTVTVDTLPTANFKPSASAVPADTTVSFNAGGTVPDTGGSIADYSWNFGDNTPTQDTGTSATASHTFTTPGPHTVTLTTTDDLNVTSTATQQITVADFTASPSIPAPGSSVAFAVVNPGPAGSTYSWDFGDGDSGSGSSFTYPGYSARGTYNVTLTITSSDGTSTSSSTGTVNVDTAPTAAFNAIPGAVTPGAPVSFDASASSAADGKPMADYSWNFGDGTLTQDGGATPTTSHKFATPGIYTVTLTTTDDLGATATISRPVIVDQPTAAFIVSPASPATNTAVTFDASMASDPESNITDYSWNFGDGTPAVDAHASAVTNHTYGAARTYTVTLTVTDGFGFTNITSQQVVVAPASSQSSGGSTPPPTTTTTSTPTPPPPPPPAPVTTPAPTPPAAPPNGGATLASMVLKLSVAGRQRLATVLAHGLRLGLAVNQGARASVQISVPLSETRRGTGRAGNAKATVVLLRSNQNVASGTHTIVLKLSRAAAGRLARSGPLVFTVRITLTGANGTPVTRTIKITLTR